MPSSQYQQCVNDARREMAGNMAVTTMMCGMSRGGECDNQGMAANSAIYQERMQQCTLNEINRQNSATGGSTA